MEKKGKLKKVFWDKINWKISQLWNKWTRKSLSEKNILEKDQLETYSTRKQVTGIKSTKKSTWNKKTFFLNILDMRTKWDFFSYKKKSLDSLLIIFYQFIHICHLFDFFGITFHLIFCCIQEYVQLFLAAIVAFAHKISFKSIL